MLRLYIWRWVCSGFSTVICRVENDNVFRPPALVRDSGMGPAHIHTHSLCKEKKVGSYNRCPEIAYGYLAIRSAKSFASLPELTM